MTDVNILIAGFQHETNTFAPSKADWAAFNDGSIFAPSKRGPEMLEFYRGKAMPIGGFIEHADTVGWNLIPSIWAGASPSAYITDDAFERVAKAIEEDVRATMAADQLDAVYLDLHGAAVAESVDDAEGEILARVRALIGPDIPLICSLDLHANVTKQMLETADAMVAYRTYPHVDMSSTGKRAAILLERRLALGRREPISTRRLPFLLPLNVQCTMTAPAASIYLELEALDQQYNAVLSFAMGFPAADFDECGPVIWGYGQDVEAAVQTLFERCAQPSQWRMTLFSPDDAVRKAVELSESASGPVVIADTQDNPGAGGDGNTTGILHALLSQGVGKQLPGAVAFSTLADPAAARAAHQAGVGATIMLDSLGTAVPTWSGELSDPPVRGQARVISLSDGEVQLDGPMSYAGSVSLGPCACLEIEGVLVVVSSNKTQTIDRGLFRFMGITPEDMAILVVKSSVHFRADFTAISSHILVAKSPGPMAADPSDLPWKYLPKEVARTP